MENLKIQIKIEDNDNLKEAHDLLLKLGFSTYSEESFGVWDNCPKPIWLKTNCFDDKPNKIDWVDSGDYKPFKEITLPELSDLVVLKRNNAVDATHIRGDGKKYFHAKSTDFFYQFSSDGDWLLSTWMNYQLLPQLQPIEKPMKEYLRKNSNGTYSYIGMVQPEHVSDFMIEVPEGAIKAYLNNSKTINFVNSDDDYMNHVTKGEWVGTHRGMHEKCGHVLVWSRPAHPEELPFIDDEPKITTAKDSELDYIAKIHDMRDRYDGESDEDYRYQLEHYISREEPSLNDQYAEIEKVRQDIINSPIHYADSTIECIDAMEAMMTPEQFIGYLRGNVFKYQWRYEKKNGIEDLKKAQWYLERLTVKVAEKNALF